MKFFVPFAETSDEALSVIKSTANFIGNKTPNPSDMIYTVRYKHNGQLMTATVGESVDNYYKELYPTVLAIFPPLSNASAIKICLKNRGVVSGEPILISGDSEFVVFDAE